MSYNKTNWVNGSSPAISADNLNKIENGIYNNDAEITGLKTDVSALKTWKSGAVLVESVHDDLTIAANSGASFEKSVAKTGYTPLGIVGIRVMGTSSGYALVRQFRIENNATNIYIGNTGTSSFTWTIYAWILYVKN